MSYRIHRKLAELVRQGSYDTFNWGQAIAATVNRVNRNDPIDVLEMEESFGWCADVQKRVSCPVVVKLHGPAFLTLVEEAAASVFGSARIETEGRALRQISAIISPSRDALENTVTRYGLDPPLRKVIPNPLMAEPGLKLWDLDACDRKLLLYVGRFDKLKGGDTVLIAFRKLLEMDRGLKLTFVGPDRGLTSADGTSVGFNEFRDSLFTEAQRPSVSYLGALPRADIFDLRRKALLSLVVSRWESQGYTALEAMLQGCPVIVTDTGGLSEMVEHGVTGLVARLDDIDDLCRNVMRVLSDPGGARRMGENARRFVTDRHSAQKLAKETVDVYRQAIAMAKARR